MSAPRPNEAILKIRPYVGGEAQLTGVDRVIKLSSNEGAFGPPPAALRAAQRAAADMHRYPDGSMCGNGSDELLSLLIHAYAGPGADMIMSAHGFMMYDITGTAVGARVLKVPERGLQTDVDAILAAVTPATRIVVVANPNNPTGSLLPQAEMARLRAGLPPDVLLIIDAAYCEYVDRPDYDPGVALVDGDDNTVMTRTFSKIFGMGGMRLGWCYAPPAILTVLNCARGPFNVSLAAQEAGIAALDEPGWVAASRAHNTRERERLTASLQACGIKVWPSEGNFVLADFGSPSAAAAADAALRRRGIIVRTMGPYNLLNCLRITVGTAEECGLVADALREQAAADAYA